ncbi:1-deoxy-D-xylulose-5-phosphate reductoisomerase [soil metagenome]
MATRRVILLGSTGSIGTQTLDVVAHFNALHARGAYADRFEVVALVAHRNGELLAEQARRFRVPVVALACARASAAPLQALDAGTQVIRGARAAEDIVRGVEAEIVVAAMVGSAGLPATLAAAELGRDIALANKETLVAAGALVTRAAHRSGARLLPVDSEHSAVWQCLLERGVRGGGVCPPIGAEENHGAQLASAQSGALPEVSRIILTASGGAFRDLSAAEAYDMPPERALQHPTWTMGAKVTIDSASLTNKAFELIEAHWLFGVGADRLAAVIHPQSIVHALVEYADGSLMAQLGTPDMRTPIQLALAYPHRPAGVSRKLDLLTMGPLEFRAASSTRFPALALAERVMREGGASGAILNAASEIAVEAYLARRIAFGRMPELASAALDALGRVEVACLDDVLAADAAAREFVRTAVGGLNGTGGAAGLQATGAAAGAGGAGGAS